MICVGDSNTFGYDPRNFWGGRYDHSWPELLAHELGCQTVNLGENGRTIPDALTWKSLDQDICWELPASHLLVMLGTNDVLNAVRPDERVIAAHMEEYLHHLQAEFPTVKLVLMAPPPIGITERGLNQTAKRLAGCYQELADRMGLWFVDAGAFDLRLACDGVHLTQEAHQVFAYRMAEQLKQDSF